MPQKQKLKKLRAMRKLPAKRQIPRQHRKTNLQLMRRQIPRLL